MAGNWEPTGRRERITTSKGLGIRTPETVLGPFKAWYLSRPGVLGPHARERISTSLRLVVVVVVDYVLALQTT